jgi:hypothetical protein
LLLEFRVAKLHAWIHGAGTRNKLGNVLNGQIRGVAFDLMREIEEPQKDGGADKEVLTGILYKLSRSLAELERAEKLNAERTEEIRKTALAEAAEVEEYAFSGIYGYSPAGTGSRRVKTCSARRILSTEQRILSTERRSLSTERHSLSTEHGGIRCNKEAKDAGLTEAAIDTIKRKILGL